MKERPILFSAPMVRAILEGRKTQTRRIVKPEPQMVTDKSIVPWAGDPAILLKLLERSGQHCPYGKSGDRLWVREAWARTFVHPGVEMIVYRDGDNRTDYGGPWKPGIYMFRRDSRITLEIVSIRVEKLQDISEADAIAEGVRKYGMLDKIQAGMDKWARHAYKILWESINGLGSWNANPWVWVIEFKVVESR